MDGSIIIQLARMSFIMLLSALVIFITQSDCESFRNDDDIVTVLCDILWAQNFYLSINCCELHDTIKYLINQDACIITLVILNLSFTHWPYSFVPDTCILLYKTFGVAFLTAAVAPG